VKWRERHLAVVTVSVCARLSVLVALVVAVGLLACAVVVAEAVLGR
jgi:hypothetical protein